MFCSDVFFYPSPTFFLSASETFYPSPTFFTRPQIFTVSGFSLLSVSKITVSDLSYCHQTVSLICDVARWHSSDGSGKGSTDKPEKNRRRGVCLRQNPLRWMPASSQKRQRWHVFLCDEKCLGTVTPRSYSTFLC